MSVPVGDDRSFPNWPCLVIALDDADAATIKEVSDGKWGIVIEKHMIVRGVAHIGRVFTTGGTRYGGRISPAVDLTPRECVDKQVGELRGFARENEEAAKDGSPRVWEPTAAALRRAADWLEWSARYHDIEVDVRAWCAKNDVPYVRPA